MPETWFLLGYVVFATIGCIIAFAADDWFARAFRCLIAMCAAIFWPLFVIPAFAYCIYWFLFKDC